MKFITLVQAITLAGAVTSFATGRAAPPSSTRCLTVDLMPVLRPAAGFIDHMPIVRPDTAFTDHMPVLNPLETKLGGCFVLMHSRSRE